MKTYTQSILANDSEEIRFILLCMCDQFITTHRPLAPAFKQEVTVTGTWDQLVAILQAKLRYVVPQIAGEPTNSTLMSMDLVKFTVDGNQITATYEIGLDLSNPNVELTPVVWTKIPVRSYNAGASNLLVERLIQKFCADNLLMRCQVVDVETQFTSRHPGLEGSSVDVSFNIAFNVPLPLIQPTSFQVGDLKIVTTMVPGEEPGIRQTQWFEFASAQPADTITCAVCLDADDAFLGILVGRDHQPLFSAKDLLQELGFGAYADYTYPNPTDHAAITYSIGNPGEGWSSQIFAKFCEIVRNRYETN